MQEEAGGERRITLLPCDPRVGEEGRQQPNTTDEDKKEKSIQQVLVALIMALLVPEKTPYDADRDRQKK